MMRKFAFWGLCAIVFATVGGCKVVGQVSTGPGLAVKQSDDPKAVALLKQSMATYAKLPAYTADCTVSMTTMGTASPPSSRTIAYEKPNRFKVVSTGLGGFVQTAVSDGKAVLEFDNLTGQPPRKGPAPDSISAARSMQMQHPMFCGTLLYQFFGGPENYDGLVDADKGAVTFGAEEKSSTGEQAKIVKFYGQQQYGHVEALIGEKSGFVYRIKYDSEPLLKMMQDPAAQKELKASSEIALNSIKDPQQKAMAEKAMSSASTTAPKEFVTEETYSNIATPATITPATFALNAPSGTTPVETLMPTDKPPVPLGSAAPAFSLTRLDGKTVSLAQLHGHPVLLDFWATWCGPCVASLPHTQAIYNQGKASGLEVLAISDEDKGVVSKFIQENKYTFPTGLDSSKMAGQAYKTDAIPTTVVIDADGKLVAYIVGGGQDAAIKKALSKVGIKVD